MAKYVKTVPIEAEQFDGSKQMIDKYELGHRRDYEKPWIDQTTIWTLEGEMQVIKGDWLVVGVNGEHWAIKDEIFKKTYAELPVIPKVWADTIEEYKANHYRLDEIFTEWSWNYDEQELIARAWLDGYQVEEDE
ncbi:hypothetical protein [Lactobacillus phage JNU_P2]|nr:hypothetical protein [Lactobacillus phage JNU_P2]QHJ74931.1 hypothetical protein [Lactobacillus phage JNU_P4]